MDVLFLCSDKKSTKRNRLGGGADRKVFRYCGGCETYAPNLEPPSPQTPSRRPVEALAVVEIKNGTDYFSGKFFRETNVFISTTLCLSLGAGRGT